MAKLYNLARMTTATTGTGSITLGAAVSGYLTFAQAGVVNGDVVDYAIKDGNNSEIGIGTYSASGTTLTRSVTKSTNGNAALNLSGTAEVFITVRAETLADASFLTSGTLDPVRIGSRALLQSKLNLSGNSNPGVANLNNLLTAGFYANTGYQNSPDGMGATGNYWYIIVQEWDGVNYTQQFAYPLTGASDYLWRLSQQAGVWSAWRRYITDAENTRGLLNTITASGQATISDTTSFASGFPRYNVVFEHVLPATAAFVLLRVIVGGAVQTTGYKANTVQHRASASNTYTQTTYIPLVAAANTNNTVNALAINGGLSGSVEVFDLSSTAYGKWWKGTMSYYDNSNNDSSFLLASGIWNGGLNALDGFQLSLNVGSFASGTIKIYGLR